MDIAALSTALSTQKMQESAGTAVLKMAMDTSSQQGTAQANMIAGAGSAQQITDPALGSLVNIQA